MQGFDVAAAATRLREAGGGYEVVHESPGLELGVYVLVAPEPDGQTPHAYDEVYVVLEGSADIEVDGERRSIAQGDAVFVGGSRRAPVLAAIESVSLLVIFNGPHSSSRGPEIR